MEVKVKSVEEKKGYRYLGQLVVISLVIVVGVSALFFLYSCSGHVII